MGYSSKTTRKEPLIQRCFSINMKIIEPSIGDHQCCEDLVVALRRWSHARIVPKGSLFFSFYFKKRSVHNYVTVWHEIFAGVYFCGLAIFCVLRELIFPIRTDWFCLELIFAIFRKYPVPSIDYIFVFIEYYTCNRNTYFQVINQYFVVSE